MAGVILVVFGLVRMGGAIKFIPYPVTIGFTSGIALIIFSSQVRDLLGLEMSAVPAPFLAKWDAYARAFDTLNPWALLVAVATFVTILVWPKIERRIPGPFVALIVTTVLVRLLHLPVETIGSRFGVIDAGLPRPTLPHVTLPMLASLAAPAFTIALLGAIESLLSAVVADGMIGGRHRSNMELVAQGIANIASPIFGGMPATGAIARTATNVKNGGRTPVAGIPPNNGAAMLATPWATSSMLERCRPPIMPSATTAESNDSIAPSMAIVNAGPISVGSACSGTGGSRGAGSDA